MTDSAIDIRPRLAFAGVGWIGRNRLQAAADHASSIIMSVYDPSDECIEEALKIAPSALKVASFDDLISNNDVDAVVIATPSALHKDQSVQAFENNKAVFCQKPLGRNAAEVKAVVDAAAKANKLLGADFSYRYTSAFKAIHQVIKSGELGEIFAVDLKFHNAYGPDKPWFFDKKLSGGGCVLDLGIHLIDLMLYALDFPEITKINSSLYSKGKRISGNDEVEDFATVKIETETNVTTQLACSWNLNAGKEAVIEASFYGTQGGVTMRNINGSFYDFEGVRFWGTKSEILASPPDTWGEKALIAWIKKLAVNSTFNNDAENFIKSAAVLDRIYESK